MPNKRLEVEDLNQSSSFVDVNVFYDLDQMQSISSTCLAVPLFDFNYILMILFAGKPFDGFGQVGAICLVGLLDLDCIN